MVTIQSLNANSLNTTTPARASSGNASQPAPVAKDSVELGSPLPTLVPNPMRPPADPKARDWRDDVIYFAMTDRFHDGDPSNNVNADKNNIHAWHGGDFQGLIEKADYIRSTGATAVWITPPMAAQDKFVDTHGYHGYWPTDLFDTEKRLGDMEKFKEMVQVMHDKGMKVILDIPLNHVAWEHPLWKDPAKAEMFHHNGDVTDWNDQYQQENHSIFGLPDWAQENPEVEKYLIEVGKFWAQTGVDGFRLDAVRSVPMSFWKKFNEEMHKVAGKDFLLIGEYYHGDANVVAPVQRDTDMDSLVDYPIYYRIKESIAKGGSMRQLADGMKWTNAVYKNPDVMGVFPDNHDTQRFLTEADGDKDKLKLALAFSMTANRIPTIFYGTEQSFESDKTGWAETSRKDMEFSRDPEMLKYFQTLSSIRNDSEALRRGSYSEMWQDDNVLAFNRKSANAEAVVVLNNGNQEQTRDIPVLPDSGIKNGTVLRDVLSGETVTVQDGKIHSEVDPKSARIFMPLT